MNKETKKVDYKHGRFNIANTDWDTEDYCYEEYVEECEMNGIEPGSSDSEDYFEWMSDDAQENFEVDMENIKCCEQYKVKVVIEGRLGLWWGHPEIAAESLDSVYDAIQRCIQGSDAIDVDVWFDDGHIEVNCHHHDGTNHFEIYAITEKGNKKRLPYLYNIY